MFINTFCYAKITLPDVPPACNKASVQQDDGNRGLTQPFSENLLQRFLFILWKVRSNSKLKSHKKTNEPKMSAVVRILDSQGLD